MHVQIFSGFEHFCLLFFASESAILVINEHMMDLTSDVIFLEMTCE